MTNRAPIFPYGDVAPSQRTSGPTWHEAMEKGRAGAAPTPEVEPVLTIPPKPEVPIDGVARNRHGEVIRGVPDPRTATPPLDAREAARRQAAHLIDAALPVRGAGGFSDMKYTKGDEE